MTSNKIGIELSSKAMYGSFCFHAPTRTLFDAGIGMIQCMGSRIFAIERVFITHHDWDHCSELIALAGLRAKTKGDTKKALFVYYPKDNYRMEHIIDLIQKCNRNLPYELTFVPIEAGHKLELDPNRSIEAFAMQHNEGITTLGYRVVEKRMRLKPIYRDQIVNGEINGRPVGIVLKEAKAKGEEINEQYGARVFCYCLDSFKMNPDDIKDADIAIMDATFIKAEDRADNTHQSWNEAINTAINAKVKKIVLAHISVRYSYRMIDEAYANIKTLFPNRDIEVCYPGEIMEL